MNKLKIFFTVTVLAALSLLGGCSDNAETAETLAEDVRLTADEETLEETMETEGDLIDDEEDIDIDELFPNGVPGGDNADNAPDASPAETEETENPLMPIIDRVLADSEWPVLAQVTDETILKEYFLIDPDVPEFEELIVMQCPMSAQMSEIIIIKSADRDSKLPWETVNDRQRKAVETDAWYPADKELAEASITGVCGDYVYFIIGENAAAAEESIKNYLYETLPPSEFGVYDND
ncbi:MAG: DUF4358 domain-containing protein [Ruminococcus sp.]|nr:DUF4358 domain-containing protein [Ruminococcus sp.]